MSLPFLWPDFLPAFGRAAEVAVPEGWPEAIFLANHGCPLSFTFETPSHAPLASRVAAHCAAVRAACRNLTDKIPER